LDESGDLFEQQKDSFEHDLETITQPEIEEIIIPT
jgi:hypothetical protein